MGKSRENAPSLGQCEQVEEAVMDEGRQPKEGEAEEGAGGGGLPLVMESDLDFLIDFFEAER
jgi:hypothetical protein